MASGGGSCVSAGLALPEGGPVSAPVAGYGGGFASRLPVKPDLALAPGPVLTVSEVAAELRVSTATVYALCNRGELAHSRVSQAIRVERRELERYLAANRKGENP